MTATGQESGGMTAGAAAQGASHGHDARSLAQLRERLRAATLRPESGASGEMLAELGGAHAALAGAAARAARWVEAARSHGRS
ncbi:MAG: hypothetical protein ACRETS_01350, partial [Steroidobacteraceae bacterium]